jgi:hypothetical protein
MGNKEYWTMDNNLDSRLTMNCHFQFSQTKEYHRFVSKKNINKNSTEDISENFSFKQLIPQKLFKRIFAVNRFQRGKTGNSPK